MTSSRLFHWLGLLITCLLVVPVCGQFNSVSIQFNDEYDSGRAIKVYATRRSRSNVECAMTCAEDRVDVQICVTTHYDVSAMTCQLYQDGGSSVPAPDVRLFWFFQDPNAIQSVSYAGIIYHIYQSTIKKTYSDARNYCHELGGYLIEIDTLGELEAVKQLTPPEGVDYSYVGATDIEEEGNWVMDRHRTPIDTGVWVWADGEPNNEFWNEHCGGIWYHDLNMNDLPCNVKHTFICEGYL